MGLTSFDRLMRLREQGLRTRVMVLEHAIRRFLQDGDRDRLADAYTNEWVKPIGDEHE